MKNKKQQIVLPKSIKRHIEAEKQALKKILMSEEERKKKIDELYKAYTREKKA